MPHSIKRLGVWALIVAAILMIPLLTGAPWDETDFIVAGALLFGAGLAYELVTRTSSSAMYRAAWGVAVGTALLLVWTNLAVGLIGNESNPANRLYYGVLATGLIGMLMTHLEPHRMSRVLFATAIAQALVPVVALAIWQPPLSAGVAAVFGVNAFFVMLFIASALLFRRASDTDK
jgi:hypothetical protein